MPATLTVGVGMRAVAAPAPDGTGGAAEGTRAGTPGLVATAAAPTASWDSIMSKADGAAGTGRAKGMTGERALALPGPIPGAAATMGFPEAFTVGAPTPLPREGPEDKDGGGEGEGEGEGPGSAEDGAEPATAAPGDGPAGM